MTQQSDKVSGRTRDVVIFLQKSILWLARSWYWLALLLPLTFLALGFLAPAFMAEGNTDTGARLYAWLRPHNHQLPQRSYFLFGQTGGFATYTEAELIASGANPNDWEAFLGNPEIGYKTGLNQRMMAIFSAILVGAFLWGGLGKRPRLGIWSFLLLSLPLLVDGFSYLISETRGLGWRTTNTWAMTLTGNSLSTEFYTASTIGSLNWWLRTGTGLLFGLAITWFLFTWFDQFFGDIRRRLEPRLRRIGAIK